MSVVITNISHLYVVAGVLRVGSLLVSRRGSQDHFDPDLDVLWFRRLDAATLMSLVKNLFEVSS